MQQSVLDGFQHEYCVNAIDGWLQAQLRMVLGHALMLRFREMNYPALGSVEAAGADTSHQYFGGGRCCAILVTGTLEPGTKRKECFGCLIVLCSYSVLCLFWWLEEPTIEGVRLMTGMTKQTESLHGFLTPDLNIIINNQHKQAQLQGPTTPFHQKAYWAA